MTSLETTAAAGQELRSTNRPIYGASSITLNNTIYIYGGFYNVAPWNKEALWTLSNTIDGLNQLNTDPYASPAVIYSSLQRIDDKTLYSFGGHVNSDDITITPPATTTPLQRQNNTTSPESLRYYKFSFETLKWTPLQKNNATLGVGGPLERFRHTTVQFNNSIYLYGGMNLTSGIGDFWKYDPALGTWNELSRGNKQQRSRCGHTSTILNDGRMIVLGGYDCTNTSFISPQDKMLYPLDRAAIYNTITNQWYEQPLGGITIPHARAFHTAVKTQQDDKIIICGGQDEKKEPFQTYMSGSSDLDQMTAMLDLKKWEWTFPPTSSYQPFPRSFAIANIVNETKMVYGLGLNYHTVYDGFYIFDIEKNQWISPAPVIKNGPLQIRDSIVPTKFMVSVSVIGATFCLVACGYWITKRHQNAVTQAIQVLKKTIWSPRAGEPIWAEICRLLFRFSFLAIFIVVSAILILQVENSPIIDQTYHDEQTAIMAPDIRFCFDGWINQPDPVIQCSTDFGESCSQHLYNITQNIQSNLNYYGTKLTCYLFTSSNDIKLGENRSSNNGSQLQFYYYGQASNNSILHVEFYHPLHDPNIPTYDLAGGQFDGWYSQDESAKFQSNEQMNLKTENVYNIDPMVASQIGYEYSKREKMDLTAWNYIGFGTKRETLYQIQTTMHESTAMSPENDDNQQVLGSLTIFPTSYNTLVMREQRAFTVIHGMGIIGGIFGLIIGLQANLFGYRPRSPWGIVHRCSVSLMRRSLLEGLKSIFSSDVHIPIVHPVHRRYSKGAAIFSHRKKQQEINNDASNKEVEEDEDQDQRLKKLEERLHVFELLFQAYYIDDEVFRSLGNTTGASSSPSKGEF